MARCTPSGSWPRSWAICRPRNATTPPCECAITSIGAPGLADATEAIVSASRLETSSSGAWLSSDVYVVVSRPPNAVPVDVGVLPPR